MIQRIQSLFLAISSGAYWSLFGLPFAKTDTAIGSIYQNLTLDLQDHMGLLICTIMGGLLSLIAIFLFKNRKLQMSLSYVAILAGFVLMGTVAYLQVSTDSVGTYSVGMAMPLAGILFSLLATVFIKKDDKLVRSMDRLR